MTREDCPAPRPSRAGLRPAPSGSARRAVVLALLGAASWAPWVGLGAAATAWRPVPEASRLGFAAMQGSNTVEAGFERFAAEIVFDPGDLPNARVIVTVDVASLRTGDPKIDAQILSAAGLDAARFPQARYETLALRPKGGDRYEVHARLSLRGVTREVTHDARITIAGGEARAMGEVPLFRTDFGIGQGPFATGSIVSVEVTVRFDLTARRVDG